MTSSGGMSAGFAIAMTDMFFSSSGALLLLLAMLRPTPDVPLPIQADIFAECLIVDTLADGDAVLVLSDPAGRHLAKVREVAEMSTLPQALGLPARLFYTIALRPDGTGRLSANCLNWVQDELVRHHNGNIGERLSSGAPRPVFGLAVISGEQTMPPP